MKNTSEKQIFTVGHSNRSLDEFLRILQRHGIKVLVDVRHFPRSRRNPQFNREFLREKLGEEDIQYFWIENLGGLREGGYEEYMKTEDFKRGLEELIRTATKVGQNKVTIMCAEALPSRCHRSLIASALTKRGWRVTHIYDEEETETHRILV